MVAGREMDGRTLAAAIGGSVCFFVRALAGGGAQRDAVLLANALAASGRRASIVTLHAAGPLAGLVDPAVPVVDLGEGGKLRMARALPALRRVLAEGGPRAYVSSEAGANALAVMAALTVPKRRRPKIVLREVASPLQGRRDDPYLQNRIGYRLAPLLYPAADLVVALTERARHDIVAHFRVPEAKAVALGTNAVLTDAALERLAHAGRRPEPGVVAAVGRLSPEKDFATLIEAVAILRRSWPVRLRLVGDGEELESLRGLARDRGIADAVEFLGFLPDPTEILLTAQLFVSSSRHEGFGNAIVEALACGLPVVATDAPYGPREILGDGRWGTLVPVGDPQALARAMERALACGHDPEEARLRASSFTVHAAAEAFAALVDEMERRQF